MKYNLLGINVDSISPDEVYNRILKLSELDRSSHVVLLDTYLLMKAKFSRELANYINSADLVLPISPGIKNGLGFLNKKLEKVYNYFNFIITLLLNFTDKKKFVYLLGGDKKTIEKADKNIKDSFPGIRLVGRFHVKYRKEFERDLITAIKKATPALILVGTRSPHQEKWIYRRKRSFKSGVFIGVGNFINIVGGKGASPSDKAILSSAHSLGNLIKNPFRIYRIFYYILYVILLIVSKIFGR